MTQDVNKQLRRRALILSEDTTEAAHGAACSTAKLDKHAKRTIKDVTRTVEIVGTQGIWGDTVHTQARLKGYINPRIRTSTERKTDKAGLNTKIGKNSRRAGRGAYTVKITHAKEPDGKYGIHPEAKKNSPKIWQVSIVVGKASAKVEKGEYVFGVKCYKVGTKAPKDRVDKLGDEGKTHDKGRPNSVPEKNSREIVESNSRIEGGGAAAVTKNSAGWVKILI